MERRKKLSKIIMWVRLETNRVNRIITSLFVTGSEEERQNFCQKLNVPNKICTWQYSNVDGIPECEGG